MKSLPPVPACLRALDDSRQGLPRRGSAAVGVLAGLRNCGLRGADRLVVLMTALSEEIMVTAPGDESATVDYVAAALGRLVGEEVGRRAGLAAMQARGRA